MDEHDDLRARFQALADRPFAGDLQAACTRWSDGREQWELSGSGAGILWTEFEALADQGAAALPPAPGPGLSRWLSFVRECFPSHYHHVLTGTECDDVGDLVDGQFTQGDLVDVVALSALACDRLPEKTVEPPLADGDMESEANDDDRVAAKEDLRRMATAMMDDNATKIMAIAADACKSAEDRAREICRLDRRMIDHTSTWWAELLHVTDGAIRKTDFWKQRKAIKATL